MDREGDERIVARVVGGDTAAFRALVERHQRMVLGYVAALVADAGQAEDVAQEAFLAAWRGLRTFDAGRGTFAGWLLRVARNRALNALRRRRPSPASSLPDRTTEDAPVVSGETRRLDEACAALPPEQRAAFLLAEAYGLSLAEISVLEDVPVGTVKSRIARALERLRASLRPAVERSS